MPDWNFGSLVSLLTVAWVSLWVSAVGAAEAESEAESEEVCNPVGRIVQTATILCRGEVVDITAAVAAGEPAVILCFSSRSLVEVNAEAVSAAACTPITLCGETLCFEARGESMALQVLTVRHQTFVMWAPIPGVAT
ncbi:MAG: hypothetical protein F6K30_06335, partial [Cyanothece sp. SIO2G6]|nr:hypothetical protein [Cyanothece sp. SIO2G6]